MLSGNRLGGVGATHEPAGDRLDIGIDSVNAPLHAIQPLVDLLKPFVDLLEALIHLFKPSVNLRKSIGDNGRKGFKPHIDGFKLCVKCLADQTHHEREVSQQHGKHAANGCPRLSVGHTTSLSPGTDI